MATNNDDTFERSVKEYIEICEKCYRRCLKPGGPLRLSPGEKSCMESCMRKELKRYKWRREIASQKDN